MKIFFKKYCFLILIILLASVLRFYNLGSTPPSLTWDETALGYNAYSVLKTARDEYGNFLPLVFKSFGDFKPGLYVYLTVPFVAFFGLTEFATRFSSAFLGVLTVLVIYFLTSKLFSVKQGGWVALALAISPWHIEFSRGAWEANVAVFFAVLGILFLLISAKRRWFLILSAFMFGLTFLTYQGAKIFTPLLLFGVLFFFSKELRQIPKKVLITSFALFLILAVFVFLGMFRGEGGRAKVMSAFSYPRPENEVQEILKQDGFRKDSLIFKLFDSEQLYFARVVLERYFNHFSGRFLFYEGDWSNKRLGVPGMGVIYFVDLIFLLLGLYYLVAQREGKGHNFILYWLFISPLPSAITRDSISAVRALNMCIPLAVLVGLGIYQLIEWLKKYPIIIKRTAYFLLFAAYFGGFVYFLDQYYLHAPIRNASTSQYGYREVIGFVNWNEGENDRIVFTQKYGQPYIYWLYYTRYDPATYQKKAHLTENPYGDVGVVDQIDNVEFRNIDISRDRDLTQSILVGSEFDLSRVDVERMTGIKMLKEINFPDGKLAFRVVVKD